MHRQKRVLLVGMHFHGRGGVEIYTVELASALRRLGYEVEVVSCLQPETGDCEGFRHTGLAPADRAEREAFAGRWPEALRAYLAERETTEDLVVAANPFALPHIGPYARQRGVPWSVIFYGVDAWDLYDSLRDEIAIGGTVISIGHYTTDHIHARVRPAAGPVELLPPPVDIDTFCPGPEPATGHDQPLVLLTVSRLSKGDWYKGHGVVIDALPFLNERIDRPVEYWIVGEGGLSEQLATRAERIGCADQVRFLGFLERRELVETYRRADVFVMPSCLDRQPDGHSTGEGFGMVFVEAAACGTPAVGLADAGAREAIAHGVSGYVAATREDIAPLLARLLSEHEFRADLGRTAAQWAATTFPRVVFDRQLGQIVKAIIGPPA